MKKAIKYLASAVVLTIAGQGLTSCDDWTDPEALDYNFGTIETAPNYQAYLQDLRNYRSTDHKLVYAWIDATDKTPGGQRDRLTALPDSIDVLVLSTAAEFEPQVLADFRTVREQKGMKAEYLCDYDAWVDKYKAHCENLMVQRDNLTREFNNREDNTDEAVIAEYNEKIAALADPTFEAYLLENLTKELDYVKSCGLDGVMFAFNGKSSLHLEKDELADYNAKQLLFLGVAADWHKRNPKMMYDFLGLPQNVTDKTRLNDFGVLFIRDGFSATNADLFSYYMTMASVAGVPTEKLGMTAAYISSDEAEANVGIFKDGTYALDGLAKWVAVNQVKAVGMLNVQNDYYTPSFTFPHVRGVIQAANPAIK